MLICISILASTTIAYFTDAATARNVITSGGISIRVVEQQLVGDTLTPFPEEPIEIMPGKTVSKIVSVNNIEQAAWVRVNYTVTVLVHIFSILPTQRSLSAPHKSYLNY